MSLLEATTERNLVKFVRADFEGIEFYIYFLDSYHQIFSYQKKYEKVLSYHQNMSKYQICLKFVQMFGTYDVTHQTDGQTDIIQTNKNIFLVSTRIHS